MTKKDSAYLGGGIAMLLGVVALVATNRTGPWWWILLLIFLVPAASKIGYSLGSDAPNEIQGAKTTTSK